MASRISANRKRVSGRAPLHGSHVLVTEDNAALRRLMADVLAFDGYCVTEATNASEMQSAILGPDARRQPDHPFDLIVSDIFMPGKNGLDALSELRRAGLACPFLFVTSFPDFVAYENIEKLDVQLLAKPFSLEEFRETTSALLRTSAFATEDIT
jgi:DNA-binding response OmpR family regulator